MKITTEQLRAIQDKETSRVKQDKALGGFDQLLSRQLDTNGLDGPANAAASSATPLNAPVPMTGILDDSAPAVPSFTGEAAERMEDMFALLEQYAGQVGGNDDLRGAYASLQNLGGQIADFKTRYPNAGTEQPELEAMLNEVEVLVTTETFKFNRGDYFA